MKGLPISNPLFQIIQGLLAPKAIGTRDPKTGTCFFDGKVLDVTFGVFEFFTKVFKFGKANNSVFLSMINEYWGKIVLC